MIIEFGDDKNGWKDRRVRRIANLSGLRIIW